MKEVPNRIMFSEMKEIYVSAQSFNKNNSSYFNSREILLAIECIWKGNDTECIQDT